MTFGKFKSKGACEKLTKNKEGQFPAEEILLHWITGTVDMKGLRSLLNPSLSVLLSFCFGSLAYSGPAYMISLAVCL